MRAFLSFFTVAAALAFLGARSPGTSSRQVYENDLPLETKALAYWRVPLADRVTKLADELPEGATARALLPGVLRALGVSEDSQVLVFSKTSVQAERISPRTPRAIFFSDDVAVGYVPGSPLLELAAVDPVAGAVFYEVAAQEAGPPRVRRPRGCIRCHQGPATLGVPGLYVSSVYTTLSGRPDFRLGSIVTDHRTPFPDRWGGWYVSATAAPAHHRGNTVAADPASLDRPPSAEKLSLQTTFDRSAYPMESSDLVALMTLEHQTQMTNLLTRAGWEFRLADKESAEGTPSSSRIEQIVRYMLFADEARLEEPVKGVSRFTESFPQRGPRDRRGRSLRDFDLERRLFRYPLSYAIYGEAFDRLPSPIRERIYRRLYDVLTSRDRNDGFDALSKDDRRNVREILRDTKQDLPSYWKTPE